MLKKLAITNFRSIKSAEITIGKITVFIGANNSGKSSFIYALLAMKNLLANPNQQMDAFLTLPFINLGGFEQTVFNKDTTKNIEIEATVSEGEEYEANYKVSLGKVKSFLEFTAKKTYNFSAHIDVAFPYPLNKTEKQYIEPISFNNYRAISFDWNGISVFEPTVVYDYQQKDEAGTLKLQRLFALPITTFSEVDFVPIRRGFTKPYFSPIPLQAQQTTEDEIATLLATDRDLAGKVGLYLEKIANRNFQVYFTLGTANFYLHTTDRDTGFTTDLVNEGLGTNQMVTMLVKILQKNNKIICIDEPEIHLHPTMIEKLVATLLELSDKEDKQFIISTHSEHFITSLLKNVAEKNIKASDVIIYHATKNKKETVLEFQEVNEHGQMKGGLKSFIESEMTNLKTLFNLTD